MFRSTLITMNIYTRLSAMICLIVLVASSVTSLPQREEETWPRLRREAQEECTSYYQLKHTMSMNIMQLTTHTARQLFQRGVISKEDLRVNAMAMCGHLSSYVDSYRTTLENCPNSEEVLKNMHVFSGLCHANGTMTAFLNGLIDGFQSSNFAWENECSMQVRPILLSCRRSDIDPTIDMEEGPQAYKNMMIEQERCNADRFAVTDVSACGDVDSLKRLACFCDLFLAVAPGVTFSLSDFWNVS